MSEAKALGALVRAGDRPKRTVMYMLWDGEEPGTLGSNAWAEAHLSDLRRHGAIYINTDTNNRGFLDVEGSHSLERYAEGVAGDVVDPERHVSAKSRALSALRVAAYKGAKPDPDLGDGSEFRIGAAGAGSDYGSFLQHVGVASLNFGYDGEDGWGSYHSIFDSFDEYTRFKDGRNFAYGVLMSQTGGRMVLRFANADVLPFAFTPAAQTYARYVQELKKLSSNSVTIARRSTRSSRTARLPPLPTRVKLTCPRRLRPTLGHSTGRLLTRRSNTCRAALQPMMHFLPLDARP